MWSRCKYELTEIISTPYKNVRVRLPWRRLETLQYHRKRYSSKSSVFRCYTTSFWEQTAGNKQAFIPQFIVTTWSKPKISLRILFAAIQLRYPKPHAGNKIHQRIHPRIGRFGQVSRLHSKQCHCHSQRIHVWYIYLHLVDFYIFYGKCRWIYHTWILWDFSLVFLFPPVWLSLWPCGKCKWWYKCARYLTNTCWKVGKWALVKCHLCCV